jgi:hypothetical protein
MTTTNQLEQEYRHAITQMQAVQQQVSVIRKSDPSREALRGDLEAIVARAM